MPHRFGKKAMSRSIKGKRKPTGRPTKLESVARQLYISFGFKFYGEDGEPSWSFTTKIKDKNGNWSGRWESKSGGDCGALNRAAAKKLWDTGKYRIDDYGGEDFDFTCTEREKNKWRTKARKLIDGEIK